MKNTQQNVVGLFFVINFAEKEMEDIIFKLKFDFEILKNLIIEKIPYSSVVLNESKWNKIREKYSSKVEQVLVYQQLNSYCIIDFIIGTKHHDYRFAKLCESMIKAINNEIGKSLTFVKSNSVHKWAIDDIISNMLLSMDIDFKSNNSDFKNWVNELFVFNKLTCYTDYTLVKMEQTLSNNKRVDYVFKNKETEEELLIDVVTLQNIDPTKHDTADTFNSFINQRIQKKYDSKLAESTEVRMFRVLPVIEYQGGMERFKIEIDTNISLPALTISRNEVEGMEEIIVLEMNVFLEQISKQNNSR